MYFTYSVARSGDNLCTKSYVGKYRLLEEFLNSDVRCVFGKITIIMAADVGANNPTICGSDFAAP